MPSTLPYQLILLAIIFVLAGALGFKDVLNFSLTRALAVASVAYRQSIRRKVLLILPPVMLAIIAVNQFKVATDARDSIRQTTNICLMSTGLVAFLVVLMAACTSIPREIESRVIHTIATKPITRLEILLGKVIGFSGVSLAILALMSLFTCGFLMWEDSRLMSVTKEPSSLHADIYSNPTSLNFLGDLPDENGRMWLAGDEEGQGGSILIPFYFSGQKLFDNDGAPGSLTVKIPLKARPVKPQPGAPTTQPVPKRPVKIFIEFRNYVGVTFINNAMIFPQFPFLENPDGGSIEFTLSPEMVAKFFYPNYDAQFFITVNGLDNDYLLNYDNNTCKIYPERLGAPISQSEPATYSGPRGKYGMRLQGDPGKNRLGVFRFQFQPRRFDGEKVAFEYRSEIESDNTDIYRAEKFQVDIQFVNLKSRATHTVQIKPESSHPQNFEIPASIVSDGDFQAIVHSPTPLSWHTLHLDTNPSLRLILDPQSYAWNIVKAMFILWLFLILATIISLATSTFLSWPIAVTLTILALISRYIYIQLGDLAKPGLGNTIVTDLMGGKGAEVSRAVSSTVDALLRVYNVFSSFLPDLSRFRIMEELNVGAAVSMLSLVDALVVAGGFGVPIFMIGWIILRHKEVAP